MYALVFFVTGILVATRTAVPTLLYLGLIMLSVMAALILVLVGRAGHGRAAICLALVGAGALCVELTISELPANHISNFMGIGEPVTVIGQVVSEPDIRPDRTFLTVAADTLGYDGRSIKVTGRIRLQIKRATSRFNYRDRIACSGYLNRPDAGRNPGAFNYRRYLHIRGIHGLMSVRDDQEVTLVQSGALDPFVRNLVTPIRDYIIDTYQSMLPEEAAAVMRGFLLGDVRYIPDAVYRRFKDTGTLHVLAASGSNVAYVITALFLFLRPFRLPRSYRYLVAIGAVLLFSFLAYNQPSVLRASVMAVTALTGLLLYRDVNPLNVIAFSSLLILSFRPLYLFDLGFQLSYAAAIGLVIFMPIISARLPGGRRLITRVVRWLILLFCGTVVAQLSVSPILLYHFHRVPLVSFASNLVVVPLVGVATALGILLVLISGLPGAGELVADLLAGTIGLALRSIDFFHTLPVPDFRLARPAAAAILAYYAGLVFVAVLLTKSRRSLIFLLLALLAANVLIWQDVASGPSNSLRLTFLDTGSTTTVVIRGPDGRTTLINGGGMKGGLNYGETVVLPFLLSQGIHRLDRVVATNNRSANLESLVTVLEGLAGRGSPPNPTARQDYLAGIERAGYAIELTHEHQIVVIVAEDTPVQMLHRLPERIDLLACTWSCLRNGALDELTSQASIGKVILSDYPNRYHAGAETDALRRSHEGLALYAVLECGGLVVELCEGDCRVLEPSNN